MCLLHEIILDLMEIGRIGGGERKILSLGRIDIVFN